MSKKVLLAIMVDNISRTTIEGCMIVDKPDGEPPYSAPNFEQAEQIKFNPPIPLTDNSGQAVLNHLSSMGIDCQITQFSG